MGVQGLWKLLESTGRPVSLESLEGKILAVDVSLWLHQAMRGMRDDAGDVSANAHLHVLFSRICKLLFYRIKPVFVFDGSVPLLKKETMAARRRRREVAAGKSKITTEKMIKNYLQTRALHTVMGQTGDSAVQDAIPPFKKVGSAEPNMFELPAVQPGVLEESDPEDAMEDYYQDLNSVDIDSDTFKSLPPEIQYEMISDMKEARKNNSWKKIDQLPRKSQDFSNYQMSRLLQRGKITRRIDALRKEMGERNTSAAVSALDIEGAGSSSMEAGRIVSEDTHHFLLVKRKPAKMEDDNDETMDISDDEEMKPSRTVCDTGIQSSSLLESRKEDDVIVVGEGKLGRAKEIATIVRNFFADDPTKSIIDAGGIELSNETTLSNRGSWTLPETDDVESIEVTVREVGSMVEEAHHDTKMLVDDDRREKATFEESTNTNANHLRDTRHVAPTDARIMEVEIVGTGTKMKQSALDDDIDSDVVSAKETVIMTPPVDGELKCQDSTEEEPVIELIGESDDDDDFLEVVVDHSNDLTQEDELFPASTFIPATGVSEVTLAAPSPSKKVDINSHAQAGGDASIVAITTEDTQNSDLEEAEVDDVDSEEVAVREEDGSEALREAARREWQDMNVQDVSSLRDNLETERGMLRVERGKQERVAASVTDLMYAECKDLLTLFGIPYIISPEEAEAQCAYLEMTQQTHGTITEDSDIWLLGGSTVYRNFFTKGKDVECFKSTDIMSKLVLDRGKLIILALLLGSDYTEGVAGVGGVTAVEILTEFPGEGIELLRAFKSWWDEAHNQLMPPVESQLKKKLRKLTLPSSFPAETILQAYWKPVVDESTEKFTWQSPDLGLLREFAQEKLAWTRMKADEILLPVVKKLNEKIFQSKLGAFFSLERQKPLQSNSKRLCRALNRLKKPQDELGGEQAAEKMGECKTTLKSTRTTGKKRTKKTKKVNSVDDVTGVTPPAVMDQEVDEEQTERDCQEDGGDSNSSAEEDYIPPKRTKVEVTEEIRIGVRRSRRNPARKVEEVPIIEAEFVAIQEAMACKTEGIIPNRSPSREETGGHLKTKVKVEHQGTELEILPQKALQGLDDLSSYSNIKGKGQKGRGKGQRGRGKGQRGRGKGHVGSKGKTEAISKTDPVGRHPKLSESSSSESED